MATLASYSARLTWFQSLDWLRASRMLCGLAPTLTAGKSAGDTVPVFKKVVNPTAFDGQYGDVSAQPGDRSRVWGVDSFVRLPAFGGEGRVELGRQFGCRAPKVARCKKGTHSGAWLPAAEPGRSSGGPR